MSIAGGSIFDMLNRDDRASWRTKASSSLEGIHATIAITIVTFFALFMDDFRLAILPTQLDVSCQYITGLIMVSSQQVPITATWKGTARTARVAARAQSKRSQTLNPDLP